MRKSISVFFVFCLCIGNLFSQDLSVVSGITPAEGANLHYKIVGFSFPATKNVKKYTLEVADGFLSDEHIFKGKVVLSVESEVNKIIAEVPTLGQQYTWRVVAQTSTGAENSPLYHFTTVSNTLSRDNYTRLRIIKEADAYKDAYVFVDCTQTLYDMKGNPVWHIPESICPNQNLGEVQDLKASAQGTITCVYLSRLFELSYDGTILINFPKNEKGTPSSPDNFHHDLTALKNGHFMVLGSERFTFKFNEHTAGKQDDTARNIMTGTVEEYNEAGKKVWSWKLSDYILQSDLKDMCASGKADIDMHMNAFCFDEESKFLYIGFKNINRIVKVNYPKGDVVAVYGTKYSASNTTFDNYFFCGQHSCSKGPDGVLYVYNNNTCGTPAYPKLMAFEEENIAGVNSLKKIWEFDYAPTVATTPTQGPDARRRNNNIRRNRGGNLLALKSGDVFASINAPYSHLLILNREKKMLWEAVVEKQDVDAPSTWIELPTYRASIMSRKELEALIWSSQK